MSISIKIIGPGFFLFFFCLHYFFLLLLFLRAFLEKSYWSQFSGGLVEFGSESICSRNILVVKFFITALVSLLVRLCLVICTLLVHFNRSHVFRNLSILCFSTCWNSPTFSLIILWQNLWNTLWFISTLIKLDFPLTSETICWFCYFQRTNSLLILCIVL